MTGRLTKPSSSIGLLNFPMTDHITNDENFHPIPIASYSSNDSCFSYQCLQLMFTGDIGDPSKQRYYVSPIRVRVARIVCYGKIIGVNEWCFSDGLRLERDKIWTLDSGHWSPVGRRRGRIENREVDQGFNFFIRI